MQSNAFTPVIFFASLLLLLPGAEAQNQTKGTPSPATILAQGDSRLQQHIFISGIVVSEDGTAPEGAAIELNCRGSVTKEATVGSDGRFAFPLGESTSSGRQLQDASQDIPDPFGRESGSSPFDAGPSLTGARAQMMPTDPSKLIGCTLRASLSGYKSSTIQLDGAPLSMLNNVGTIVLFPIEKMQGVTVSATSLLAPKSAKKAMEKATVALRKNKGSDAEKHLKSAIALYPKYGEAWFQIGRLYQSKGRIQDAREAFYKAIEIDSLYVNPYIWLAWMSAAEQKWQEAADLSERALALDRSAFPQAFYVNALANFNLNNVLPAEQSALQAERLDAAHRLPKIHLILASISLSRNDLVGSIEQLRNYLKYGPRGAIALQEYDGAPVLSSNWETATESMKREMASHAGSNVRLMLAEALLGAGMTEQGKAELAAYMKSHEVAEMPQQTRAFWEHIQDRKNDETPVLTANNDTETQKEDSMDYLRTLPKDLPDFEPASDQAPMDGFLASVGKNVSSLFADLLNVSALESVQLQKFDRRGEVEPGRKFEYLYLCLGAIKEQDLLFDEFRSDERGNEIKQLGLDEGYMLTAGFMSSPLLFHPIHQSGNSFRLLGYQKLRGRNTILLAFAQIPSLCRLPGRFQVGKDIQDTYKQGIAWIDAENFQILRLVSDLLQPLRQIGLKRLNTQVDFDEVRFSKAPEKFWLPVQVIVTVDWNGKILRNIHTYSDFRLFDVKASQKIQKPNTAKDTTADPD